MTATTPFSFDFSRDVRFQPSLGQPAHGDAVTSATQSALRASSEDIVAGFATLTMRDASSRAASDFDFSRDITPPASSLFSARSFSFGTAATGVSGKQEFREQKHGVGTSQLEFGEPDEHGMRMLKPYGVLPHQNRALQWLDDHHVDWDKPCPDGARRVGAMLVCRVALCVCVLYVCVCVLYVCVCVLYVCMCDLRISGDENGVGQDAGDDCAHSARNATCYPR